jgi:hypothetical protein
VGKSLYKIVGLKIFVLKEKQTKRGTINLSPAETESDCIIFANSIDSGALLAHLSSLTRFYTISKLNIFILMSLKLIIDSSENGSLTEIMKFSKIRVLYLLTRFLFV